MAVKVKVAAAASVSDKDGWGNLAIFFQTGPVMGQTRKGKQMKKLFPGDLIVGDCLRFMYYKKFDDEKCSFREVLNISCIDNGSYEYVVVEIDKDDIPDEPLAAIRIMEALLLNLKSELIRE